VIAPDLIGFGFSSKPWPYQYTFKEQAEMVIALMAYLNLDKVHILAHDYGDSVTQELLAMKQVNKMEPFKICSICFLNGGLFMEATSPNRVQRILLTPLGPLVAYLFTMSKLKKNFISIFGKHTPPSTEEIAAFWQLITHNQGKRIIPGLIQYIRERKIKRDYWLMSMQNTKVPMRLVIGAEDPISGKSIAKRYEQLIPNPDVVLLSEVGHYPQIEAAEKVLDHYCQFIDRIGN